MPLPSSPPRALCNPLTLCVPRGSSRSTSILRYSVVSKQSNKSEGFWLSLWAAECPSPARGVVSVPCPKGRSLTLPHLNRAGGEKRDDKACEVR